MRLHIREKKGEFRRTSNRHNYALEPYGKITLGALKEDGYNVIDVGEVEDTSDGEGTTEACKSESSVCGMEQTLEIVDRDFHGLCFVNLMDFDALQGHRGNPGGYGQELERFDIKPGELLPKLWEDDLLSITANHGNDPTYKGTDHIKEMVPLLAYSPPMIGDEELSDYDTLAVIGAIIAGNFKVPIPEGITGASILKEPP